MYCARVAALTKSQIDRLGERLREQEAPDVQSREALRVVCSEYDAPLATAERVVRDLGFRPSSRIKTTGTLIEKLKREKTTLSTIQDIAGLRIVEGSGPADQDAIVVAVASAFRQVRVIDRRRAPSHGYRAVHVVASVDDRKVEIQVRTRLQDQWAQVYERLADRVGRSIRYGALAGDVSVGGRSAAELVAASMRLSEHIAVLESRPRHLSPEQLVERLDMIAKGREEITALFGLFAKTGLLT